MINVALGVCVVGGGGEGYLFNQIVFQLKEKKMRICVIYLIILIRIKYCN